MRWLTRRTEAGNTVLSSVVLGLALMGDALLYAVLPLHAETFGISLFWVGVLLSANRFVRLFLYGWVSHLGSLWGLGRLMVAAAVLGAGSTFAFAFSSSEGALLGARVAWGLAFAAMAVSVMAYATHVPQGAAVRVGWSFSIRQIGPLLALTGGAWLANESGPRVALFTLGCLSLLAVPLALRLPNLRFTPGAGALRWWPGKPGRVDLLKFGIALTSDGLFVATIGLLLYAQMGPESAVLGAGLVLAARQLGAIVLSPLGGMVGDWLGKGRTAFWSVWVLGVGLALLAMDWLLPGIALVLVAHPILLAVLPPLAVEMSSKPQLSALASLNTWRDLGSAIGPLVALPALGWAGAPLLYGGAAVLVWALAGLALGNGRN